MTVDERLEKLVVRHEALSQTVELLGAMHQEVEKQLQAIGGHIDRLVTLQEKTQDRVDLLLSVVANHEQRLNGIEGS
jgi:hypothetical protein